MSAAPLFTLAELREAAQLVYREMPPTPQYAWPLLGERFDCEIWLKHENHTPTGAFKIRGGITYIAWLCKQHPEIAGIVTATRGNHGQAQARAARKAGLAAVIVVPLGNSVEKNQAMRGFGAEVIEYGADYNEAAAHAAQIAEERGLYMTPSFDLELVRGVASYGLELFDEAGELDAVYVPIGNGSGICATIAARDALGLRTKIIGTVSTRAPAVKNAMSDQRVVAAGDARTFADGVAVRIPNQAAFDIYAKSVDHVVAVDDDLIAEAMRVIWQDSHNLAEGAGAIALAGFMAESATMRGKRVAAILTGGNIDQSMAATVLAGKTPQI